MRLIKAQFKLNLVHLLFLHHPCYSFWNNLLFPSGKRPPAPSEPGLGHDGSRQQPTGQEGEKRSIFLVILRTEKEPTTVWTGWERDKKKTTSSEGGASISLTCSWRDFNRFSAVGRSASILSWSREENRVRDAEISVLRIKSCKPFKEGVRKTLYGPPDVIKTAVPVMAQPSARLHRGVQMCVMSKNTTLHSSIS